MGGQVTEFIEFHGQSHGTCRMTWGQRHVWETAFVPDPTAPFLNSSFSVDVTGHSLAEITDCTRLLLERHESLRTTYDPTGEAGPQQVVQGHGSVALQIREAGPHHVSDVLSRSMKQALEVPFTADEIPVRATVVMGGSAPRFLILNLFHMAVDRWGREIAERDFQKLLDGTAQTRRAYAAQPVHQPRDRALFEAGADGAHRSARAVSYLNRCLDGYQGPPARPAPGADEGARYQRAEMTSPNLFPLLETLASKYRVSVQTVFVAAFAAAMAATLDVDPVVFQISFSNRIDHSIKHSVGTYAQRAMVRIEVARAPFDELVSRAASGLLTAYRNAHYDPLAADFSDLVCLNLTAGQVVTADERPQPSAGNPLVPREPSTVRWQGGLDSYQGAGVYVMLRKIRGSASLGITLDTAWLSKDSVDAVLTHLEPLLTHVVSTC
ncbi:condensation domain-containing protein [Kitasatospora viridis]|uniref:Condensation domain-containing protein n=1 Tax=Kitasatospora viridis TaxID=281105 RepID=A0A561UAC8_9ACTN|nr:condensation domain-containing protein [Kitasatospora viridis]TWF96308.1 condensation domain-containing protein [Kitasatospora viridis]